MTPGANGGGERPVLRSSLEFLGRGWIFGHRGDYIVKRAGHPHNAFPGE